MSIFKSPIFALPDFKVLLASRWLQTFSLQFLSVIIGWQVYELRHEALLLGLIGLTEAVPAITSSFFAGHFVDVSKPAFIFRLSTFLNAVNALFIFVGVCPWLQTSGEFKIGVLFAGIFISGITRSFISPAQFSLLSRIVPREHLPSAAAFNSSSYTLSQILGPAVGGLVYGLQGPTVAFAIPVLGLLTAFLISLQFSSWSSDFHPQAENFSPREPLLKSIQSGLHFLLHHRVLLSAMALDMFSVLFGGAVAVLPIFADQVFHVGPTGLGILRATPAAGSVLISLYFGLRPMKVISGGRLLFVIAGFGACMIGFGCTSNIYLALLFLLASGVFDGVNMVIRGTLTQLLTPGHMRGRVSSLSTVFVTSSNEIGAFESGVAAHYLGLIPSVIFGGIMTLLIVLSVYAFIPELKQTRIGSEKT